MGLCYSLRPLLFGVSEDRRPEDSESPAEGARHGLQEARTPVPARPDTDAKERRRAEEREARKVSRGIDRLLREQKRDLQQTHRLLLLGR